MKVTVVTLLLCFALSGVIPEKASAKVVRPHDDKRPRITSLIGAEDLRRMIHRRTILSDSTLIKLDRKDDADVRQYDFFAAMMVNADMERTRQVVMDYRTYSKLVPYISETTFYPELSMLLVMGGIWRYQLAALVQFHEQHEQWIEYHLIRGHFQNLAGDILFEPVDAKRTLVLIRGKRVGEGYPPRLVVENGAELVFRHTARQLRHEIENGG